MGRRRLPALLVLVAGLVLGAGPGAQGAVPSTLAPRHAPPTASTGHATPAAHTVAPDRSAAIASRPPRPPDDAVSRAGRASASSNFLRDAAALPSLALLAVALAAFLVRRRRRTRPGNRYRSPLLARGPPRLLAS